MRKTLFLILFPIFCYAQDSNNFRVKSYLDTLCSPFMAGRGYVDSGHVKAANYLAAEFERIGLKPIGKSFYQFYTIDVNTFPGEQIVKYRAKDLSIGKDYICKSFSNGGKAKGKMLRLDSALFSTESLREEFLKKSLKRKFVVYGEEDVEKISSMPLEFVEKLNEAKGRIVLQKKLTSSYSSRQYNQVQIDLIDTALEDYDAKIKMRLNAEMKSNLRTQNVIGYLPAHKKTDEYIIISAHYDHMGKMGEAIFYGANDNASGTSFLMDMASYYSLNPQERKYNLIFIAFGAEETGLNGSEYFVKNSPIPLNKIRFVLNLDLMGNGEKGITVVNGRVFEDEMAKMDSLNTTNDYLPKIKKRGKAANSDHYHFSERGVPAFFIYTMGGKPWYHDIYDKPEELTLGKYEELQELFREFLQVL